MRGNHNPIVALGKHLKYGNVSDPTVTVNKEGEGYNKKYCSSQIL